MPYCSNCGNEIQEETQYCPFCGKSQGLALNELDKKQRKKPGGMVVFLLIGFLFLCSVVAVLIWKPWKSKPFSDNPKAIEKASISVVRLQCYDKDNELYCTGSAFAALAEGVFVTNYHVIEQNTYRIEAYTEEQDMFEINSVLAIDSQHDIAILKTDAQTKIQPLMIGESDHLEKGEKVVAIGSPLGFLNTVSTGVFSGYNRDDTADELQFSASISHGSSGGALLDDDGKVIGVTCASYEDGQNLNVAVPIQYVQALYISSAVPMTVIEFYETFDHSTVYTVDEVLENCYTLSDDNACIVGYIAGVEAEDVYIASNLSDVDEYVEMQKAWRAMTADEILDFVENTYPVIEKFRNCNFIEVTATGEQKKSVWRFKVGDYVRVKTDILPREHTSDSVQYIVESSSIVKGNTP